MSVAVGGTTESYHEKDVWWNSEYCVNEMSRERRAQLAAEIETAFRNRCSAFVVATVEMIRRQCENCLSEAVEDALSRYSMLLHDNLQLNRQTSESGNLSSTDKEARSVNIKMEEITAVAGVTEDRRSDKTDLEDVSGCTQWASFPEPEYDMTEEYRSVQSSGMLLSEHSKIEKVYTQKEILEQRTNTMDYNVDVKKLSENMTSKSAAGLNGGRSMAHVDGTIKLDAFYSDHIDSVLRPPSFPSAPSQHTCEQCGRSFSRKSHLIRHRLVHTGERPFHCHICHRRFSQKVHLSAHMCTHSSSRPVASVPGEMVERQPVVTTPTSSLTQVFTGSQPPVWPTSIMRFPITAANPPPCPVHSQPPVHAMMVAPEPRLVTTALRRHRCHECGKSFTRSSHLNRHRLIHTGERPHVCSICRKAFSQKVHLQAHLRRQHQDFSAPTHFMPSEVEAAARRTGTVDNVDIDHTVIGITSTMRDNLPRPEQLYGMHHDGHTS